ncbi:hypothetical protein [Streptomyces sp. NPDC092307]|uniref:hypothetical protein n=1 Tax=Streptomyces sp. NPDC092307 TaxID=3366013 RepID=UPI00380179AC
MAWLARYSHEGAFVSRVDPATGDIGSYRNPLKDTDGIAVRGTRMLLTLRFHNRPGVALSRAELVDDAWVISAQEKPRLPGSGRHVLRPRPRRPPLGRPSGNRVGEATNPA